MIWERVEQIANGVAEAYGCSAEVTLQSISPVVENDTRVTDRVRAVARSVLGDEFVLTGHRLMVSEDMGYFLVERPGCYFVVGAGSPGATRRARHHSPDFDLDEGALSIGAKIMAAAIVDQARSAKTT